MPMQSILPPKRLTLMLSLLVLLVGCQKQAMVTPEPDYSRPLPPGTFGLERIADPSKRPDLTPVATQVSDPAFQEAAARGLVWFAKPSTHQYFPAGPISHPHARTSLYALADLGRRGLSPQKVAQVLRSDFDVWRSVGWDGSGEVFFTGYYSPVFEASRTRTPRFQYPIYRRPADLWTDAATGAVVGGYPTRAELQRSGALDGLELVYLPSRLDAYIIEVNGSAKLNMADGSVMHVGYAGTNGHTYTSLGRLMVKDGLLDEDRVTLPAMRAYFRAHPDELDRYIRRNDRMVFFQPYAGGNWPAGSLGFKVTTMRTLATDKDVFPRGVAALVDTTVPQTGTGGSRPFRQLMLDQDTGGAIQAAGRADLYFGVGAEAETLAGRQAAEGRMYYLLLKPEQVQPWYDRMAANREPESGVQ